MTDYQKERINSLMRSQWESYNMHSEAVKALPPDDEKAAKRHYDRMLESLGWLNGARETALILGYSIRYENNSLPQVV